MHLRRGKRSTGSEATPSYTIEREFQGHNTSQAYHKCENESEKVA